MSQPEEIREKSPKTDAVLQPPTANPDRTQLRDEPDRSDRGDADRGEADEAGNDRAETPSTSGKSTSGKER